MSAGVKNVQARTTRIDPKKPKKLKHHDIWFWDGTGWEFLELVYEKKNLQRTLGRLMEQYTGAKFNVVEYTLC